MDDPETPMTRKPSDSEPFSGLAFKVMADQFLGTLTFVRVYRCCNACQTGVACVRVHQCKGDARRFCSQCSCLGLHQACSLDRREMHSLDPSSPASRSAAQLEKIIQLRA